MRFSFAFFLLTKKAKVLTNNSKHKILTKHSKLRSHLCHGKTKKQKHPLKSIIKQTQNL
jgi:hypothetical protein